MKQLTIIVPEGDNNLSSISGAYEIFTKANGFYRANGQKELFHIQLAGISEEVEFNQGIFTVKPHLHISQVNKTDLIIIPSLNHNYNLALEHNEELVQWLRKQYTKGAEIATICTGAFMLAASGLLDGKTCSTHWSVKENFSKMFPKINLQIDELITDENGIYTNGGAYSFLNLMIYLIEKYYGRATAVYCAKVFQIEMNRSTQSQFIIFSGQKKHEDEMVLLAQSYIEQNLGEKLSMSDISNKFNVSRRNFDRRFIKATGNTPSEYLQRVKIEAAKKAFETDRKTVNEVMYEVGYSDVKAFRDAFKKITGLPPMEYKKKYHKGAA
ncbi:Helix-turn-helix-domain containing protein AraC type [Flavobacterium anhuiense]|uniref:Helix-turn-helix-domain containing protein AraC type n=1 Tax=Flavobacterium anhuiense TaxID=459526 RepID=A0A444VW02_9FLAO|nr:helix-turn-helix domain-containing protein [Flavobacterium anhuiense]RYJ37503.1 Helix-turn-helix-domain containing protein AraC type [Flavobacterium anhuiense]